MRTASGGQRRVAIGAEACRRISTSHGWRCSLPSACHRAACERGFQAPGREGGGIGKSRISSSHPSDVESRCEARSGFFDSVRPRIHLRLREVITVFSIV
jgi:hypothetical protein